MERIAWHDTLPIVDYSNPLSRGCVGFVTPFTGAASKATITGTMAITKVGTPDGLAFRGSGVIGDRVTVYGLPLVVPPFTVMAQVKVGPVNAGNRCYFGQGGAGAGKGWSFKSFSSSYGQARLTFGNVADYTVSLGSETFKEGKRVWLAIGITGNGGQARFFIGGNYITAVNVGTMGTPASTSLQILNNSANECATVGMEVNNVTLWNRCLSDAELKQIGRDPFGHLVKNDSVPIFANQTTAAFNAWLNYHRRLRL